MMCEDEMEKFSLVLDICIGLILDRIHAGWPALRRKITILTNWGDHFSHLNDWLTQLAAYTYVWRIFFKMSIQVHIPWLDPKIDWLRSRTFKFDEFREVSQLEHVVMRFVNKFY